MNEAHSPSEGPVQLRLDEDYLSVVPGGKVTFNLYIENLGSNEDYFELSVRGLPESWVLAFSPIVHLSSGEEVGVEFNLQPSDSPQPKVGSYPFKIRVRSQENPEEMAEVQADLTIRSHQTERRITILMESTHFSVVPGKAVSVSLTLSNRGLEEDHLRLAVDGIPTSWVSTPSAVIQLAPGEEKGAVLTISPPVSPQSKAGRHKFSIRAVSQLAPSQFTEVECILTIATFTQFRAELVPQLVRAGEVAMVTVWNEGNHHDSYDLSWWSRDDMLIFQPPRVEDLRVPPGEAASARFTLTPRRSPLFGGEIRLPFGALVASGEGQRRSISGEVITRGFIPIWVLPIAAVICLALVCATAFVFSRARLQGNRATQTAIANMTAAAVIGEEDTDGDGLTNRQEIELGTDPQNPDTDGDGLLDGDEVQRGTDPLNPDSDGDGLLDGDEVQRGTDPLKSDTDGDGLLDGDEIRRGTDPRNPDTDGDRLPDGSEIELGTNPLNSDSDGDGLTDGDEVQRGLDPLNADTDRDQLSDGEEVQIGSDPTNPDTDGDGIIDGLDPDPTNPANPSLTATAAVQVTPSPTITGTTAVQTGTPTSTITTTPQPTSTSPSLATPLAITGDFAFESNRDGNREIYVLDAREGTVRRLTDNPEVDTQPVWSPNGDKIAFSSRRDGNNEIYLMNPDGSGLVNLTNDPGSDRYPAWSPDGQLIAFTTDRDGNPEIYTMQIDGSEVMNLTQNPSEDSQPVWFSTGVFLLTQEKIAFTSNRDGNLEIYIMNTDGSSQTNLTRNPAGDAFPAASPGGARIAFTTDRDGNQEVYVMGTDGSSPTNLTMNPSQDWQPAWSPLGDYLAWVTNRDANQEIYVMRNDGAGAFNLTNNPAEDLEPSWR